MRRWMRKGGMALPLALVAVAIITLLLGGVLLLSVSHLNLSHVNSCYANAMKLAEAGVNWELNQVSRDPALANTTPVTVALPSGSSRSFTVHIEAYPSGGAWVPGQPFWVISTGTVDGVSRTVRVVASGTGPSGLYALFGIDSLSVSGDANVVGAVGSNGYVDVGGSTLFDGDFLYCGSAAGSEANVEQATTGEVLHSPLPESFPTVDEIANLRSGTTQGVTYLKTHNDNASVVDTYGNAVPITSYDLSNKVFQKAERDLHEFLEDGVTPNPLYGKNVIVLGPGDYYLENLEVGGNDGIRVDTSGGTVNIWLGPAPGDNPKKTDTILGNSIFFPDADASGFNLYVGCQRTLKLNGCTDFYGDVYAYNGPDTSDAYYGSIQMLGTTEIYGSVIGYSVTKMIGNGYIEYPSSGGTEPGGPGGIAPGEPVLFYGFHSLWEEVNPA